MIIGGRPFICLCLLATVLFSCSKGDKGAQDEPRVTPQHVAGTLPVRIMPEAPVSSDDLQAVFAGEGAITYVWQKNGTVLDNENSSRLSRKNYGKNDSVTVIVTKGNEKGSATVIISNPLPRVTSVSFAPEDIHRGVDITAVPVASSPDGSEVRFDYRWSINGESIAGNSPVLKGDRFKKEDRLTLVVMPIAGNGGGAPYKTREVTIPNASPAFVSVPAREFRGATYTYRAVANDPDGDVLTYSLASAPEGMTIDAKTGVITWQIAESAEGIHKIEIVARDTEGGQATQEYSLSVKLNRGTGQ